MARPGNGWGRFLLVVVHVYREARNGEEIIRIISARAANKYEVRVYSAQAAYQTAAGSSRPAGGKAGIRNRLLGYTAAIRGTTGIGLPTEIKAAGRGASGQGISGLAETIRGRLFDPHQRHRSEEHTSEL